jgi:hypothetical protein
MIYLFVGNGIKNCTVTIKNRVSFRHFLFIILIYVFSLYSLGLKEQKSFLLVKNIPIWKLYSKTGLQQCCQLTDAFWQYTVQYEKAIKI